MKILTPIAIAMLAVSAPLMADPIYVPSFTNLQYYVFASESVASNALTDINSKGGYPFKGKNAKTKKTANSKASTTSWGKVAQRIDSKCIFRRIPPEKLSKHHATPEEKMAWLLKYQPTIEPYDPTWFPED